MFLNDFTSRFREELEDAILHWNNGNHQPLVDIIDQIQRESYQEGCCYITES